MGGFAYAIDGGKATEIPLHDGPQHKAEFIWIHLSVTNEQAQAFLGKDAGLPDYVISALTAVETRPRCDAVQHSAFLNLRGLSNDDEADKLASVRIYAREGWVYSVTRRPLTALDKVREEMTAGHILDPGDLIAEFATAITEELDPVVADLGDSLDACEECMEATQAFELRRKVNTVRIEAIQYRRFLFPQRAALDKLAALPGDWLAEDDRQHLLAAADRAARMAEEADSIRERAGLMHETLTDLRAELIDERSLVISIAAMVFLPLTFLTGLYGMNVKGLWLADKPWAFEAIVAICVVTAVGVTGYFYRQHWTR